MTHVFTHAKASSSKELDECLPEIEEKNKHIEALLSDNKRLKAELAAAYKIVSKIKLLCEECV